MLSNMIISDDIHVLEKKKIANDYRLRVTYKYILRSFAFS